METFFQVTAAILEKDGRILIAKRKQGDRFAGLWEFPGGKLEPGETPEACLRREILEELGAAVRVDGLFSTSRYACTAYEVELLAYHVTHVEGELRPREHEEIRWISPSELENFEFSLPDIPAVMRLKTEFSVKSP
jgi:8-oxo-dGTP diphosphatase